MEVDSGLIQRLTSKGILAYIAVSLQGSGEASTASLAALVRCQTGVMLEGLKELAVESPTLLRKAPKNKWSCGEVKAGEGLVVQNLDSSDSRRKEFLDDVKAIYEWANPGIAFTMSPADGVAVQRFLRQHRDWNRALWQQSLRNRFRSDVVLSQGLYLWLGRLVEYVDSPLDRFGKPKVNGGLKHGQAIAVEQGNRAAREAFLSGSGR